MPAKIAVLHVGTHKTGTKSLQSMLSENLTWFADQGLYCPVTGNVQGGGHHNLAWQLSGDLRFEPANGSLDDLVSELGQREPRSVFLSSEDFECLYSRTQVLADLRFALEELGYRVEVVVVLRDPIDYVPSLYQELRKHGLEQTANEFVVDILSNGGVIFGQWDIRINYKQLVTGFADAFGSGAVHALRYERTDSVGMVLGAASVLLRLPLVPIDHWPRRNVSVSQHPGPDFQLSSIEATFGGLVGDLVRRYPV